MSRRPPPKTSRSRPPVNTGAALHVSSASTTPSMAPDVAASNPVVGLAHHALLDDVGPSRPPSASSSVSSFALPSMIDPAKLYEAYNQMSHEKSLLEAELKSLKVKIAALEMQLSLKNPGVDTTADDLIADIKKWGRHFSVFFSSFVPVAAFCLVIASVSFVSTSPLRYASVESVALGVTLELYECLPGKFHDLMKLGTHSKGKDFIHTFRKAISASRSSTILLLRRDICPKVFGIPSEYFGKNYPRNTVPKIQAALGSSVGEDGTFQYPRFPPFLYLNEDTSNVEFRFLNERLFMIARAILFGPNAATDKTCAYAGAASTYIRPDRPAETTFGLIAYVAVTTRYALSIDDRFDSKGVGPKTGINYASDFNFYKRWLIELQGSTPEQSAYIKRLLHRWNSEVFSTHNSKNGSNHTGDSEVIDLDADDAEIARDLNLLRLNASVPTDVGGDTDSVSSDNDSSGDIMADNLAPPHPNQIDFHESEHEESEDPDPSEQSVGTSLNPAQVGWAQPQAPDLELPEDTVPQHSNSAPIDAPIARAALPVANVAQPTIATTSTRRATRATVAAASQVPARPVQGANTNASSQRRSTEPAKKKTRQSQKL